jgi:hypothetical protein
MIVVAVVGVTALFCWWRGSYVDGARSLQLTAELAALPAVRHIETATFVFSGSKLPGFTGEPILSCSPGLPARLGLGLYQDGRRTEQREGIQPWQLGYDFGHRRQDL